MPRLLQGFAMELSIAKNNTLDDPLLSPRRAAQLLGLSTHTLAVWRHRGDFRLPFIKISGRAIRYRRSEVMAFIEKNRKADVE